MTIKAINESMEEGVALKTIAAAYTEINSLRLKKIREQVIRTRTFFVEVLNVYALLRHIVMEKGKLNVQNKKTAKIVLTSNNRFYGHIESDLIKFFLSQEKITEDIFVVGRNGREAFKALNIPFKSIIFKNDIPEPRELTELVGLVKNHKAVLVYFDKFKSILSQIPVVVDITQSQAQAVLKSEKIEEAFIFEPEVPKILAFFDSQLKQVLLEETFLETELARTSSKLISMDQAQNNADEFLKDQKQLLTQAKISLNNTQILETIAGIVKAKHI